MSSGTSSDASGGPGGMPGMWPSLSDLDHASGLRGVRVWLATEPTDMRCGFDRLAALAQIVTGQDPPSAPGSGGRHLFVFRGKSGDRLKILWWDRDGYVLWYKRLEEGVFKLPRLPKDAGGAGGGGAAFSGTASQRVGDVAGGHRPVEHQAEQAIPAACGPRSRSLSVR